MTLQEGASGVSYTVQRMELPVKLERRLGALGMIEGAQVAVLRKKRHGAMIVTVRGTRFAIGYGISTHVYIEQGGEKHGA